MCFSKFHIYIYLSRFWNSNFCLLSSDTGISIFTANVHASPSCNFWGIAPTSRRKWPVCCFREANVAKKLLCFPANSHRQWNERGHSKSRWGAEIICLRPCCCVSVWARASWSMFAPGATVHYYQGGNQFHVEDLKINLSSVPFSWGSIL